jgi:hypothetical protein
MSGILVLTHLGMKVRVYIYEVTTVDMSKNIWTRHTTHTQGVGVGCATVAPVITCSIDPNNEKVQLVCL